VNRFRNKFGNREVNFESSALCGHREAMNFSGIFVQTEHVNQKHPARLGSISKENGGNK
jgi:hypothetical protein